MRRDGNDAGVVMPKKSRSWAWAGFSRAWTSHEDGSCGCSGDCRDDQESVTPAARAHAMEAADWPTLCSVSPSEIN